jgi:hypothetical protein
MIACAGCGASNHCGTDEASTRTCWRCGDLLVTRCPHCGENVRQRNREHVSTFRNGVFVCSTREIQR